MRRVLTALVFCAITLGLSSPPRAQGMSEAALWQAVRDGEAFAIMRHALAPGTGDPASFDVADCATQRNLNGEGRDQARAIGQRFRDQGIGSAAVFSSAWCRCQDTAELLDLGEVTVLPSLNSFYQRSGRAEQTEATRQWLRNYEGQRPLVLVTHQVNISALMGDFTRSGETLVGRIGEDGAIEFLGSLGAP